MAFKSQLDEISERSFWVRKIVNRFSSGMCVHLELDRHDARRRARREFVRLVKPREQCVCGGEVEASAVACSLFTPNALTKRSHELSIQWKLLSASAKNEDQMSTVTI